MAKNEPTFEEVIDGVLDQFNMDPKSKDMIKNFGMAFVQTMTADQKRELVKEVEDCMARTKTESEPRAFD